MSASLIYLTSSFTNTRQDERRMAKFMQYAVVAAKEALDDARWKPESAEAQEATVSIAPAGIVMQLITL